MTSKYFSYYHNFEDIIKNDPILSYSDDYWYINPFQTQNWCCSNNVFTQSELERIRVIGKRLKPRRSVTGINNTEDCLDFRRSFTSWISPNSETEWIFRRIVDVSNFNNDLYWKFDLDKLERLQFTHYLSNENGTYSPHVDPIRWSKPHNRKLSIVIQLSDPSEYEGGELKLHTGHEPDIIRKEMGLATFFPSYTLHEVTPVTKGERYSLVTWIHGPTIR